MGADDLEDGQVPMLPPAGISPMLTLVRAQRKVTQAIHRHGVNDTILYTSLALCVLLTFWGVLLMGLSWHCPVAPAPLPTPHDLLKRDTSVSEGPEPPECPWLVVGATLAIMGSAFIIAMLFCLIGCLNPTSKAHAAMATLKVFMKQAAEQQPIDREALAYVMADFME